MLVNVLESTCQFDNVTVQSKSINSPYSPYSLAPKVYCGTNPPLPMRIKDEVIVTFTSDAWIAYEGFKISYKIDGRLLKFKTILITNL